MKTFKQILEISDGDWIKMSHAQKIVKARPKHGASAFEDRFNELKKKKDIKGLKKLRQVSQDTGQHHIVKMIDDYLK